MNKVPVSAFFKSAGTKIRTRSPQILTALGIIGMAGTIVTAVKATPKAKRLIEEATEAKGEKLTPIEVVKTTWKCYAIPAASFIVSSACMIGATVENTKRNTALAAAAALSETALQTYKSKVIETIGENAEKEIREKAREEISEKQKESPATQNAGVYYFGGGKVKCVDYFGKPFEADPEDIRKVVNDLNEKMRQEMQISLNEFYDALGVKDSRASNDLVWDIDRDGYIEVVFMPDLDENNRPVLVVNFRKAPDYYWNRKD